MIISRLVLFTLLSVSVTNAQPFDLKFDVNNASGWFGGDNRPGQQRNVAVAQSVFISDRVQLQSFAFYFTSRFDFAVNPTGSGHEVTLRLRIRDSAGSVLRTEQVVVQDTFSGGWVVWPAINLTLNGPATFIFSTHLVGGYDVNQVTSSQRCDANAGYSGGARFVKYVENDSDAVMWGDWSNHSWDSNFWLMGTLLPTGIGENETPPHQFELAQNYPNPFNPSTTVAYYIPSATHVSLKIFDLLGRELKTLVNENQHAGRYQVTLEGSDLASGMYLYRLQAGKFVETRKMLLMK